MKLELEAKTKEQVLVKAYLEANVSDLLADKINNGTPLVKDGKTLINKKTLDGFMKYASDEARKLASKGANSACVEDKVVYGWAIHYFEENGVEETLYNEDGTEYKPTPKTPSAQVRKVEPPKPISPVWQSYQDLQRKYPDCIILHRLGDFYEAFGNDAITLSNELNLTLTGRDFGLESRIPMIGFPYHAADNYIRKIVEKHKVAIAETKDDIRLLPDEEDEYDDLTEEEMRKFDGDIEEPKELDNDYELDTSAFDTNALATLDAIFGDKIILR